MPRTSALLAKAKLTPEEVAQIAQAAGTLVTKMEQSDANDDGKYSTTEIAFGLMGSLPEIGTLVARVKDGFLSFRAFNVAQRRQVIAAFAQAFDLSDDIAEERIETGFHSANVIVSAIADVVVKFRRHKAEGETS